MLKLKFFPAEKGCDDDFNTFMESHAPRNGKNSPGIIFNQQGVYVAYEDGEPYSKPEQEAEIMEMIRGKKYELLISEPMIRLKRDETEQFKLLMQKLDQSMMAVEKPKGLFNQKNELKQKIEANEAWLLTNEANQTNAREQITYLQKVLEDIRSGVLTI